jgi:hypothetical protein
LLNEKGGKQKMTNEEIRTTILSKINLLLGSINESSKREVDLMVSQTIQALSESYKNLEGTNNEQ